MSDKKRTKKRFAVSLAITAVICMVCVIVVFAFFTDKAEISNVFTFGSVEIVPNEPSWKGDGRVLVANEELLKDPAVANNGSEEAIVFAKVDIPVNKFTPVVLDENMNGVRQTEVTEPIFKIEKKSADGNFTEGYGDGWVTLSETPDGTETPYTDGTFKTVILGYSQVLLPSEEKISNVYAPNDDEWSATSKTTSVFDAIKLKSFLEKTLTGDKQVNVSFYAIQAEWVKDSEGDYLTGVEDTSSDSGFKLNGTLDKEMLKKIWDENIAAEVMAASAG